MAQQPKGLVYLEDLSSIPRIHFDPLPLPKARSWKLTLTWPLPVFVNSPGKSPEGTLWAAQVGWRLTERAGGALTRRKALTAGTLLSSTNKRRAFSWLLQYSSYTQNLSFCKTRHSCETPDTGRGRRAQAHGAPRGLAQDTGLGL